MQDWIRKMLTPVVRPIVEDLAKSDTPALTEVPSQMQIGYPYTGGARRKQGGVVDFDTLRTFSAVYDVARACINYRKRQIANLEWNIVPKDSEVKPDQYKKQIDKLTAFFENPCNQVDFKTFNDRLIEDLLVLDAGVLWKDRTYGGELKELIPIDGSTIRLKVTEDGTYPEPPEAAFQQILFGELAGEYNTDEMKYYILNPRNNTPYGLSPLECLIIGVDTAMRSQLYNANLLSEGSVPEGFFGMPPEWTPDQIKDFQVWFDTMMGGNNQTTSRIKFMPGGKGVGYIPTKRPEDMRFLEMEKWLLLKTCAIFDVQPEAIGFIENVTKTTGTEQQELGNERGLVPMANFLKKIYTQIIADDFDMPDLKFEWKGLQVVDDDFELNRNVKMLQNGALTINEWRTAQGLEPFQDEVADKPMIFGMGGAMLLDSVGQEPDPAQQKKPGAKDDSTIEEMDKWETKCINALKRGKSIPEFAATAIEQSAQTLIRTRLSTAKSREDVREAFRPFKQAAVEQSLITRALQVRTDIADHKRTKYERIGSRT